MRDKIREFFIGRQGMDELSKALFWGGIGCFVLSAICYKAAFFSSLFLWLCLVNIVWAFFRAFSRNLPRREAENAAYFALRRKAAAKRAAAADRRRQSKDYRFFKCPGCGTMLRVPRGKGKIHITCKCGYTLYRKT